MAVSASLGATTEYSGSALRYGLVDIKPIEVVETIKRYGIKFTRTHRKFESLRPSQSYEDHVTLENEAIFNKIDIPTWFDAEKLVSVFSQRSINSYKDDTELQKMIEEVRKSQLIEGPLLKFTRFFLNRFESRREEYVETEANRFLTSNFPLSFYSKFVVLDNTYYNFLKVLEQTVRIHEFRGRASRSFLMYSKHIKAMKKVMGPLLDQMDLLLFSCSCLKRYVTIWNAKSYEEIEKGPEFLDIKKVDYPKFEQMNNDFKAKLLESRVFLLRYDPRLTQKEQLLENESTAEMFRKLVMLPSGSLSLER